jgi:hypothetical protein
MKSDVTMTHFWTQMSALLVLPPYLLLHRIKLVRGGHRVRRTLL